MSTPITASIEKASSLVAKLKGSEMNNRLYFLQYALEKYNFLNRSFVYKHASGSVSVNHKAQTVTY